MTTHRLIRNLAVRVAHDYREQTVFHRRRVEIGYWRNDCSKCVDIRSVVSQFGVRGTYLHGDVQQI